MAAHVFVIDSSARRQQIKTTPGTYLRDVLEEACKRFGKDPEQFTLSDSGRPPKTLDLSLTIRLSGLVNGAKLQLTQASRSASVINVALKLPQSIGGQRLQDKFPSTTSLWLVLRKFEEAVAGGVTQKLNLTQRGVPSTQSGQGRLEYEQPVIKIMQRELADFMSLQKTLAQLGYNSGSVLLQLDFMPSGLPIEEAITQISQYFKDTTPATEDDARVNAAGSSTARSLTDGQRATSPNANASTSSDTPEHTKDDTSLAQKPVQPPEIVAPPAETPAETTNSSSADHGISVYKPPSSSTPLAAVLSTDESDFTPTVEHAQSHQATLARASQNRRLQSDAELAAAESEKAKSLSNVTSATIRIRFPDQMQVDLTISATDTAQGLYERVRDMLSDATLGFELRYTGPKGQPKTLERGSDTKLIRGLGWKGKVLVTMVWAAEVPVEKRAKVLKESLVGQARELSVPTAVPDTQASTGMAGAAATEQGQEKPKQGKGKGDLEAKMKKFLGFGKK